MFGVLLGLSSCAAPAKPDLIGDLLARERAREAAHQWNQPESVHGVMWGASTAQFRAVVPGANCYDPRPNGTQACFATLRIGDIPVVAQFFFRDDQFARANLGFASNRFTEMWDLCGQRYGTPSSSSNLDGRDSARGRAILWNTPGSRVVIVLAERGQDGGGFLNIELRTEQGARYREERERAKERAKDL